MNIITRLLSSLFFVAICANNPFSQVVTTKKTLRFLGITQDECRSGKEEKSIKKS